MSQARHASYSDLTNPALQHAINQNCLSTIHLARLGKYLISPSTCHQPELSVYHTPCKTR
ncbi:hypothetical protein DPMN_162968 [Dreissena polymorpha]|uniref:Uncharacterized protein n=1 Tax=Dreissena polymorpha TaxID=45954 RepID=A0A9D4IQX8_DREPO|nr:hypothetical protein DPMN_162968 [Dreissena polymorpha]